MNRDAILADLASTPTRLRTALDRFDPKALRTSPDGERFALVEHFWHLADLEAEGYGMRIARLLTEERPSLPDFEGDRIARERAYKTLDAHAGLAHFTRARSINLARLATVSASDWTRRGVQAEVGEVTLSDVARMMHEHDREHLAEIAQLPSLLSPN